MFKQISKYSFHYVVKRFCSNKANSQLHSMIRVNHAGEFGADRIYCGQMFILGNTKVGPKIREMWEQEKKHRQKFEEFLQKYRVRPTVMLPLWDVMGFLLGASTAALGSKGAMACTVAIETVIVEHYNEQLRVLSNDPNVDEEIKNAIKQFRDEEQEHHDIGIDHDAEQAPFYSMLSGIIKTGSKLAIEISKRI